MMDGKSLDKYEIHYSETASGGRGEGVEVI